MPATVEAPLAVLFTLPGGVTYRRRLDDLPNQRLAAHLAAGLAAATHPHGPIRTRSVAMQYVQTARRMVRELHDAEFGGGLSELSPAVIVEYWLGCDFHRGRVEVLAARRALYPDADTALAYLTLFAMRTGIVPDGIDALTLDDITRTSTSTILVSYTKGRTGREALNLPRDAVRLLDRWLEHSAQLRAHAGDQAENVWLYVPADDRGTGHGLIYTRPRTQTRRAAGLGAGAGVDQAVAGAAVIGRHVEPHVLGLIAGVGAQLRAVLEPAIQQPHRVAGQVQRLTPGAALGVGHQDRARRGAGDVVQGERVDAVGDDAGAHREQRQVGQGGVCVGVERAPRRQHLDPTNAGRCGRTEPVQDRGGGGWAVLVEQPRQVVRRCPVLVRLRVGLDRGQHLPVSSPQGRDQFGAGRGEPSPLGVAVGRVGSALDDLVDPPPLQMPADPTRPT